MWKLDLVRNSHCINTHSHVAHLSTLRNTDLQPILAKYGVIQYDAEYIDKEKQMYGNGFAQIENALTALSDSELEARNATGPKKFGDTRHHFTLIIWNCNHFRYPLRMARFHYHLRCEKALPRIERSFLGTGIPRR